MVFKAINLYLCRPFEKVLYVMDHLNVYSISFKGLKEGLHQFDYKLNESFFSLFENSPINESDIDIVLALDKKSNMLVLNFDIKGTFKANCDRCINPIDIPLTGNHELLIKFSEEAQEKDEVKYINFSETEINVGKNLFEYCVLNMPMSNRIDCEDNGFKYCNHDILDRLDSSIGEEEEKSSVWDNLKGLDIKDN